MKFNILIISLSTTLIFSCSSSNQKALTTRAKNSDVKIAGAMKHVMWKGEISSTIDLDTIQHKNGLYGLGPVEYLKGELLIIDGKSYVSTVLTDSTMKVEETFKAKAPFFVYANATEWNEETLPENITTLKHLEEYINQKTTHLKRPFVFKLAGQVENAVIHIQNLPEGTQVSSPAEAHQRQTSYDLKNRGVEIVGFFSTEHQGVFTHHDSFLHMHLITTDKTKMGHLDNVTFGRGKMRLFLPKE